MTAPLVVDIKHDATRAMALQARGNMLWSKLEAKPGFTYSTTMEKAGAIWAIADIGVTNAVSVGIS